MPSREPRGRMWTYPENNGTAFGTMETVSRLQTTGFQARANLPKPLQKAGGDRAWTEYLERPSDGPMRKRVNTIIKEVQRPSFEGIGWKRRGAGRDGVR